MSIKKSILIMILLMPIIQGQAFSAQTTSDVIVYGGTSAGVIAAYQVARMGKSVVLINPDSRIGGMTTNGLGRTDSGDKSVIGGLAFDFYARVGEKYGSNNPYWTFEPKIALEVFQDFINEENIPVIYDERLDLSNGVIMNGADIDTIIMESGNSYKGRVFIDATYEGDLMAKAGVTYTIGREANSVYGETYNGIQAARAVKNQLPDGIDPYIVKADPQSGRLPGVNLNAGGTDGSGDDKIQAYCFRMSLTDNPANRVMIQKPAEYNELDYEILFRAIELGQTRFFKLSMMPNNKTDSNNDGGISSDYIGRNYDYAEADYATRERIKREHEIYQKGLVWTLQHHDRVPQAIKDFYLPWGLPLDEFEDNGHWPEELYIRETRRMISDLVMDEDYILGVKQISDPVAMGSYAMDSHNVQRYITDQGYVKNEGDVQINFYDPYSISYRSIVPSASEVGNLIVPVCLSASHIAYSSIRIEPVFMILGQSAATAAVLAIDNNTSVQAVDYHSLYHRLVDDGQILPIEGEMIIDNGDSTYSEGGSWASSTSVSGYYGSDYRHDDNAGTDADDWAEWTPDITTTGDYDIYLRWTSHANRPDQVPVEIRYDGGAGVFNTTVNQQVNGGKWNLLGTFKLNSGNDNSVTITGADEGYTIADAIKLIPHTQDIDRTDAGGTVTAQYIDSPAGEEKEKAFDNSSSTKYLTFHASGWIQFQFARGKQYPISKYTITSANDEPERDPSNWTLQGSNDGSSWTTLDTRYNEDFPDRFQKREFTCSNTAAYAYYRLDMTNNGPDNGVDKLQIAEIELIGSGAQTSETTVPDDPEATVPDDSEATVPDDSEANVPDDPEATVPDDPEATVPDDFNDDASGGCMVDILWPLK